MGRAGPGSVGSPQLLTDSRSTHSGPSWQRAKRNSNVAGLPSQKEGGTRVKGAILNLQADQIQLS